MQESDQHDLSDDSDYAAAISAASASSSAQVSRSMSRMDSSKSTASDGGGPSEIVFLKDNVAIHPTQYTSERISGRLRLFLSGSELFLSWIPYRPDIDRADSLGHSSRAEQLDKGRSLYTIKAVPVSDVRSIRRHTPALSWPYIIVVMSSGLAFPPFYFYSGGLREFLAALKQHVSIVRSADDSNVFLVNDFQDPLQKTLSSLELPGVVSVANRPLHRSDGSISSVDTLHSTDGVADNGSSSINQSGRNRNKSHDPARDISIQVLEKFSLVTRFARETTSQLFGDIHTDGYSAYEKKHDSNHNNSVTNKLENEPTSDVVVPPDPLEIEKLPHVWGKQRMQPLSVQEWSAFLDAEGRILDSKTLRERIFYGGVDHALRKEVWKFLLGYHEYDSTYAERDYLVAMKKSEYEVVKSQWKSISTEQAKQFTKFRERKGLIDKDVVRTDRSVAYYEGDNNPNITVLRDILVTYSFYNFDLGYCQGMSDFLAPILYVMEDESESFWCFVALMKRLGPNFNRDQSGMHSQLFALSKLVELLDIPLHNYLQKCDSLNFFFCFRWILIQFKREFEYDEIMRLWEVLWTHYLSEHFHLYVCVAILKMYRTKIIGEQMNFDTLLKFINELSGQIDLERTIRDAEALCAYAGDKGAACIPPGTPPSLPVETDHRLYSLEDDVL